MADTEVFRTERQQTRPSAAARGEPVVDAEGSYFDWREPGKTRAFQLLPKEEIDEGAAALAAVDPTATEVHLVRHLGRRLVDGAFVLGIREPNYPLQKHNINEPWSEQGPANAGPGGLGMMFSLRWWPLGRGIALLRSDANPEIEVERRERCQAHREAQAKAEHARMQAEREERQRLEDEKLRLRQELGIDAWMRLAAWQRCMIRVAMAFEEKDPAAVARQLYAIAWDLGVNGGSSENGPGMRLDKRWR